MQKLKDYLLLFLIAGGVVALDQYSKWLVKLNLSFAEMWLPDGMQQFLPYFRIVNWHNSGAAFGLFQNGNIIFVMFGFVVSGVILYYYPRVAADDWWMKLALGLQMGGALGNLIDRLRFGRVTDFISVGSFPVFNVADSAITVGTIILLLGVYLKERKLEKQQKSVSPSDTQPPAAPPPEVSKSE